MQQFSTTKSKNVDFILTVYSKAMKRLDKQLFIYLYVYNNFKRFYLFIIIYYKK